MMNFGIDALEGQFAPEFWRNILSKFKVNVIHYPIVEMAWVLRQPVNLFSMALFWFILFDNCKMSFLIITRFYNFYKGFHEEFGILRCYFEFWDQFVICIPKKQKMLTILIFIAEDLLLGSAEGHEYPDFHRLSDNSILE